ncbi:MAG: hypothetical protein NVSMB3_00120 [Acidobacteriaceae bacterium]
MRKIYAVPAVLILLWTASCMLAQQPEIVHAQLTAEAPAHGLSAELESLKRAGAPVWVGYAIPAGGRFGVGWGQDRTAYLEGEHASTVSTKKTEEVTQDHAVVLLRIAGGAVGKLRVESPERQIDAGGLRFVWLTNVSTAESLAALKEIALADGAKGLRDAAVFAIAIHRPAEATAMLVDLAAPGRELSLREKAAFWLANQRGSEGFAAVQGFARKDADSSFREKIAFDLTISKEPGAMSELIRMAHEDASPQVRKQAQFWMATRGGKQVAGDLRRAAESDPDQQVRKQAVFALSRLPGEEAATQLIQVAGTNRDPEVRKQAIFWLGQSSDPRALEYLTKLLQGGDRP